MIKIELKMILMVVSTVETLIMDGKTDDALRELAIFRRELLKLDRIY